MIANLSVSILKIFETISKFFLISFGLSLLPIPQFKLSYIPLETPFFLEKKQCFKLLLFNKFFE